MGSLFKPLEVDIPSTSPEYSAHSSPNKAYLREKRKTLPIVNPLVNDPSWPSIASGGVVGKGLLSNADAICAVASPLMDPDLDHVRQNVKIFTSNCGCNIFPLFPFFRKS
jgi:hypothetical protein